MTLFLRASEGAFGPSRLRRLTACSGLVSISLILSAAAPQRANAHPHHQHSESSSAHHPALIKVSTAKLRSGPGTDKKATALLDEGRAAVVVGRKDGWVKIRLDSGREGWLRHDLVDVAKSSVRASGEDSDDGDTNSTAHHRRHRHDSDDEDKTVAAATSSREHPSHHKARPHDDSVARVEKRRHEQPSHSSRHIAHVTAIHVSAPHRVAHVTELSFASSPTSDEGTTKTTELKVDSDSSASDGTAVAATSISSGDSNGPEDISSAESLRSLSRGDRLVRSALAYRGTPYRMGATGNGAFDCSGFTMYLFGKEGSSLPRTAAEQYEKGEAIPKDHLQPGDLVFFHDTYKSGISHVGIYIGNNSFVHASGYGRGVRVDTLDAPFYVNHWAGARRPR